MKRRGEILEQKKSSGDLLFQDLSLLASLYFARFLIWRTLRRRAKERALRRKRLRLIQGGDNPEVDRGIPS